MSPGDGPGPGADRPPGGEAADPHPGVIRAEAVVRGRVQGVGFRMFAARVAAARGIGGWVANEPDGSVRCVAEGDRASVEAFLRDVAGGPLGADVHHLEIRWLPAVGGVDRFEIRAGWHSGD